MAAIPILEHTRAALRDLHARESMRLGWYRQMRHDVEHLKQLRNRKAQHLAFLNELLRKRGLRPLWYARLFYMAGLLLGLLTARLPKRWGSKVERTLEFWILIRYRKYLKRLRMDGNLRSMVEAMQLSKLAHNEPGTDVLQLLEHHIEAEERLLKGEHTPYAY